jgi:[histone H3]-trimethyl-L-lysine4 demethylase
MEEQDCELCKADNIIKLIKEAEQLGFDCSEITQLNEYATVIKQFSLDASTAIQNPILYKTQDFEELLETGQAFNVDIPVVDKLDKMVQQMK